MRDAVIVEAVRTPVGRGKPGGGLSTVHPVDLLAHSLRTLVERTGIDPGLLDDVIGGAASPDAEHAGTNPPRCHRAARLPHPRSAAPRGRASG